MYLQKQGWVVCKNLKTQSNSKHRLTQTSLWVEGSDEDALCSLEVVAKEQSPSSTY
jgi:hypothetical protein